MHFEVHILRHKLSTTTVAAYIHPPMRAATRMLYVYGWVERCTTTVTTDSNLPFKASVTSREERLVGC